MLDTVDACSMLSRLEMEGETHIKEPRVQNENTVCHISSFLSENALIII